MNDVPSKFERYPSYMPNYRKKRQQVVPLLNCRNNLFLKLLLDVQLILILFEQRQCVMMAKVSATDKLLDVSLVQRQTFALLNRESKYPFM